MDLGFQAPGHICLCGLILIINFTTMMYKDYDYESEYEGTYAHDIAGLDDDFINDVLDGEPEAYWNID